MNKKFELIRKLTGIGFLALTLSLTSLSANAQDGNDDTKIRFGVKGGLNLSQLFVDEPAVEDENIKLGLHGGFFLKAPLGEFFAIQPELLFSSKGAKVDYNGSSLLGIQAGEVRFNLNYIDVPVLASVTLGPISLQAGPYVSYLINANVKNLKRDGSVTDARDLDRDDFNKVDYGLAGGLAVDIKGFQVGARYNYGLNDIGKSDFAGRLTRDSRNSVAQAFVAIGF